MDRPEPILLTVGKAAKLLSLHKSTVYEMCYTGQIKSIKIGRQRRVLYEDLQRWVQEQYEQQAAGSG
jgi:excisionase family DNA binding protein